MAARAGLSSGTGPNSNANRQLLAGATTDQTRKVNDAGDAGSKAPGTPAREGSTSRTGTNDDEGDDEEFQPLRKRGWRKARVTDAQDDDEATGGASGGNGGKDGDDATREDGTEAEAGAEESPPTPNTLHPAWQEEVAVVRRLKHQGLAPGHPAMQAACSIRDEAERTWRDAKDPAPAAIRLAGAQAKLDRAIEIQAESRQALMEYEGPRRDIGGSPGQA